MQFYDSICHSTVNSGRACLKRPDSNITDKSVVCKGSLLIITTLRTRTITAIYHARFLVRIITFNSIILWGTILSSHLTDAVTVSERPSNQHSHPDINQVDLGFENRSVQSSLGQSCCVPLIPHATFFFFIVKIQMSMTPKSNINYLPFRFWPKTFSENTPCFGRSPRLLNREPVSTCTGTLPGFVLYCHTQSSSHPVTKASFSLF